MLDSALERFSTSESCWLISGDNWIIGEVIPRRQKFVYWIVSIDLNGGTLTDKTVWAAIQRKFFHMQPSSSMVEGKAVGMCPIIQYSWSKVDQTVMVSIGNNTRTSNKSKRHQNIRYTIENVKIDDNI